MLRPNFWPEGSKIVDNPSQVAEIFSREERSAKIAEIQKILREQSRTLPEKEKKGLLAKLFDLMEEDEVARAGEFDTQGNMHASSQIEKDEMCAVESVPARAVNDSDIEEGSGKLVA